MDSTSENFISRSLYPCTPLPPSPRLTYTGQDTNMQRQVPKDLVPKVDQACFNEETVARGTVRIRACSLCQWWGKAGAGSLMVQAAGLAVAMSRDVRVRDLVLDVFLLYS